MFWLVGLLREDIEQTVGSRVVPAYYGLYDVMKTLG